MFHKVSTIWIQKQQIPSADFIKVQPRGFSISMFCILSRKDLIAGGAGNAESEDAVSDAIEFFGSGFLQTVHGCLAVDSIDHYLLWGVFFQCFQPRTYVFFAGVVEIHRCWVFGVGCWLMVLGAPSLWEGWGGLSL